jgi:hypothetical protein
MSDVPCSSSEARRSERERVGDDAVTRWRGVAGYHREKKRKKAKETVCDDGAV